MFNKKVKLFNKSMEDFKRTYRKSIFREDLETIKKNRDRILASFEIDEKIYTKNEAFYKDIITKELKILVYSRLKTEYDNLNSNFETKDSFKEYISNFWLREDMKEPMEFKRNGWGGAGLIITNDINWKGDVEGDVYIFTEDYRFCVLITELYYEYRKFAEYIEKFILTEIFGRILTLYSLECEKLELNKEIFDKIIEEVKHFFEFEKLCKKTEQEVLKSQLDLLNPYL